jgi:hypothetical protein
VDIQMIKRVLVFCALAAIAVPVFGGPITYTYDGSGAGTLNGQQFNGAFTFTAQADTSNITPWADAGGGPQNTHLSATLAIAGLGVFDVLTPSHTWLAQNCCGGLGANLSSNWITLSTPAFVSVGYGLDTSFGPIVNTAPSNVNQFNGVSTSGGILNFQSIETVTFTASTGPGVPEPGTLSVFVGGLGLILFRVRSRPR